MYPSASPNPSSPLFPAAWRFPAPPSGSMQLAAASPGSDPFARPCNPTSALPSKAAQNGPEPGPAAWAPLLSLAPGPPVPVDLAPSPPSRAPRVPPAGSSALRFPLLLRGPFPGLLRAASAVASLPPDAVPAAGERPWREPPPPRGPAGLWPVLRHRAGLQRCP